MWELNSPLQFCIWPITVNPTGRTSCIAETTPRSNLCTVSGIFKSAQHWLNFVPCRGNRVWPVLSRFQNPILQDWIIQKPRNFTAVAQHDNSQHDRSARGRLVPLCYNLTDYVLGQSAACVWAKCSVVPRKMCTLSTASKMQWLQFFLSPFGSDLAYVYAIGLATGMGQSIKQLRGTRGTSLEPVLLGRFTWTQSLPTLHNLLYLNESFWLK